MATAPVIATDTETDVAALSRLAAARDTALSQSNRFLLFGMAAALFYCIKLVGLRLDVVIADTKIFETPYGLFVFGIIGAVSFTIAQLRFLDGKALDLDLKELCPITGPISLRYATFPSAHHWLLPAQVRFGDRASGKWPKAAFSILGLVTLALYLVPLFAAIHFLIAWPKLAGESYTDLQWWLVFMTLVGAFVSYMLAIGVYDKR